MILDKVTEYPFVRLEKDPTTNEISFYSLTVFKGVKAKAFKSSFEKNAGTAATPHVLTVSVDIHPIPSFSPEATKPQLVIHHAKLGTLGEHETIDIYLEKRSFGTRTAGTDLGRNTGGNDEPASSKDKKGTTSTGDANDPM